MEKKNGKGKEYNYNGELKFEGEYENGKKVLVSKAKSRDCFIV